MPRIVWSGAISLGLVTSLNWGRLSARGQRTWTSVPSIRRVTPAALA